MQKRHYMIISLTAVLFVIFSYVVSILLVSYEKDEVETLPKIIITHEGDAKDLEIQKRLEEDFDTIIAEIEQKKGALVYDDYSYAPHEASELEQPTFGNAPAPLVIAHDTSTEDTDLENLSAQDGQIIASSENQPRYVLNAEPTALKAGYTPIAIIIDDLGIKDINSRRSVEELPSEITMSFLPYGDNTQELAHLARTLKHEVMIHLPMEAMSTISPGDNALYVSDTTAAIAEKTHINLNALKDISVGVNNHMGSRFTSNLEGMAVVYPLVEAEGLMFLDSLTTASSIVSKVAQQYPHTPFLKRDSFIDHVVEEEAIKQALTRLEKMAHKKGYAVAIGHPHTETLNVLEKWVQTLDEKKIQLVPITAFIR